MTYIESREIPSHPGYFADPYGHIWSHRFRKKKRLSEYLNPSGYYQVPVVTRNKRGHTCSVHRLVAEAFHGPCPVGMECCHLNGIRSDNRPDNLTWATRSENMNDMVNHGTRGPVVRLGSGNAQEELT